MTKNQTLVVTETSGDSKAPTTRRCNCGCGQATSNSKTQYKPGHDARHASAVARRIVEGHLTGSAAEAELAKLGSEKLHHKSAAMVSRLLGKLEAQAKRELDKKAPKANKADKPSRSEKRELALKVAEEEDAHNAAEAAKRAEIEAELAAEDEAPAEDEGDLQEVKLGRWVYPARRLQDGTTERNTKRDGSGEWVVFHGDTSK